LRSIRLFLFGFSLLFLNSSTTLSAYAFLSEFVAKDFSAVRDPQSGPTQNDDLILSPRWYVGSALDFRLCVGGSAIDNTPIRYGASGLCDATRADGVPDCSETSRNSQVLDDFNAVISDWNTALTNTDLSLNVVGAADASCGPALGAAFGGNSGSSAGQNDIFFNNKFDNGSQIPQGVVAFTILNFTLQNERLELQDADIVFNNGFRSTVPGVYPNRFVTTNYTDINGTGGSFFNIQGVLAHEMGHLMGLAHSFVTDDNEGDSLTTGATMYPSVGSLAQTVAIATLQNDDILGIKNLYANSSTFTGSAFGGKISGLVQRSNNRGQRGAQVTVFSTTLNRTYASVLSGMDGTASAPLGSYAISGLPLNHNFIVFVDDAERDNDPVTGSDFPNWNPDTINTPLSWALDDESEGLKSFALEAYPDAEIVDVRVSRNVGTSPGISNAEVFRPTSGTKTIPNVNFYISARIAPPNDKYSMALRPTTARDSGDEPLPVSNDTPLQLEVNMEADLSTLAGISISVKATNRSSNKVVDLEAGLPTLANWRTTRALLTLAPPSGGLAKGTYDLTVSLSSTFSGESLELVDASRALQVNTWNSGRASISFGSKGSGSSGGGGGGCSFDRTDSSPGTWVLVICLFASFIVIRRKQQKNSLAYRKP